MLTQIYVKNFVLIDEVRLEFGKGMSVFTGETGAGKSLLIDAISMLCGARAFAAYVKKGAPRAIIEGVFDIQGNKRANALLAQQGYELDGEDLLVSREITAEGKSIVRIQQRPATAAFLRELMEGVIDIHSQHDNQYLLQSKYHRQLLDRFCRQEELLAQVADSYQQYHQIETEIETARRETLNADDLEFLTFQLNEIDDAQLKAGELEELEESLRVMNRYETIRQQAALALEALDGEQGSNPQLYEAARALESVSDIEELKPLQQGLLDAYYQIEDHIGALRSYLEQLDYDEAALNAMQERVFLYHKLYRKYGGSHEAVLAQRAAIEARIDRILHRQDYFARMEEACAKAKQAFLQAAGRLSEIRRKQALVLEAAVQEQLKDLMLEQARFHIAIRESEPSRYGVDQIEFQVSMNRQDRFTPLNKTASGGELSRLMLGLKCIFTRLQGIDTVIFDEIDTGVSGSVALAIGRKMQLLASDIQVFCVTHLAQVAACADQHLYVSKQDVETLTTTSITPLSEEERIRELAQIASSSRSEASLQAARELYAAARR